MQERQISKVKLKSTLEVNKYLQFENKCHKLLRNDEIRFIGIINDMGNLIAGGFNEGVDLLETDEQRSLYMQMAFEIDTRKDFDSTLGKINYVTTNRDNVLIITIPMNNYVVLISAKPEFISEQIVKKVNTSGIFQTEI